MKVPHPSRAKGGWALFSTLVVEKPNHGKFGLVFAGLIAAPVVSHPSQRWALAGRMMSTPFDVRRKPPTLSLQKTER
jgi:hypothetical protein